MVWPPKPLGSVVPRLNRVAPHDTKASGGGAAGAHASTHSDGGSDEITVEDLATALGANEILMGDGSGGLASRTNNALVLTGTYVGDGSTSNAVTVAGIGTASLRAVIIWGAGLSAGSAGMLITTDTMVDDNANGLAYDVVAGAYVEHAIIALGTTTFTVDDNSANTFPNSSSTLYKYMVIAT